MDTSELFNFIMNDPNAPVPSPWERVVDLQGRIIYYRHGVTGFMIYDFRPLVNFGGGVYLEMVEDPLGFNEIMREVRHLMGLPTLYLFCTDCAGRTVYGLVDNPLVSCPLCHTLIMFYP
ncbi:hypothetical protein RJT34_24215 [Clitoria ternatea]|uniref:Uncharacterized protein n=1 Tax=Clitoria ternatea TaxID=43366 RepID=A0AAN9FP82_CLITE